MTQRSQRGTHATARVSARASPSLRTSAAGTRACSARIAAAAPCQSAQHHAFDFWIGRWEVRTRDGRLAGTSRIEPVLSGGALLEHWTGAGAGRGTSLNFYDGVTREWEQTWIDDRGRALYLRGGLDGGRVRQLWESSTDDGASWRAVFDGTYTPHAGT